MARATVSDGTGKLPVLIHHIRTTTSVSFRTITSSLSVTRNREIGSGYGTPLGLLRTWREKPFSHEQRDRKGHDEREEQY
jgi:hypothetical protein